MSNVVNYDGAVGVAVVHGCERLVAFLAGGIPIHIRQDQQLLWRSGSSEVGWRRRMVYQISNFTVVDSSKAIVCVRKAAPIVLSR